jgi:hypothetical protein
MFQSFVIPPRVTDALWDAAPGLILAATALLIAVIRSAAVRIERKLDETRAIHCANRKILQDTHDDIEETRRELHGDPARRHHPRPTLASEPPPVGCGEVQ